MNLIRALATSLISACISASGASAQTYPDRPVTMLVAFPPGGVDDATARLVQDPMQKALGQPIVIENLGGAGGMIAAAKTSRAKPDGYTILLHQVSLATGMSLYPNISFDAEKDFVTIGLVNTVTITLAGHPSLQPNNFDELLRWVKESGQNIRVAHPGVGSFGHLVAVLIFQELGVKVTLVPYRGAGPALIDLLAGRVDLGPVSAVVAGPLVNARAFAEQGMSLYPPDEQMPETASALLKREIKLWADVIRANHIVAQ